MTTTNRFFATGIFAIVFSFCGATLAFSSGFMYYLGAFYGLILTASIFTIIAGFALFVSFAFGIVAIKKNVKYAFTSAIISFIASIIILCSLAVPNYNYEIVWGLSIPSGILCFIAAILFMIYWLKAPYYTIFVKRKKKAKADSNIDDTLNAISKYKELFDCGILTEEEFIVQKNSILGNTSTESAPVVLKQCPERALFTKRQVCGYIWIPICVVSLIVSIVCPTLFTVNANNIYESIEYEMKHYDYGNGSEDTITELIGSLPNNYRDVDKISQDSLKISSCLSDINDSYSTYRTYDDARDSYITLYNFDDRWDLSNDLYVNEKLLCDITWRRDDDYFEFKRTYSSGTYSLSLSTNLPNEKQSGRTYYYFCTEFPTYVNISYEDTDTGASFLSYKVSNLKYYPSSRTMTIDVYCYSTQYTYTLSCMP